VDEERQVRYPSLASGLGASRIKRQSMAEELRVLYVAMTRARGHLIGIRPCGEDKPEQGEARWAGGQGSPPPDRVQGASSMLEWLGPVAAVMKTRSEEPIQIITHSAAEVRSWPTPESLRPPEGARQKRLAELMPLSPPPGDDRLAREIIARLDT